MMKLAGAAVLLGCFCSTALAASQPNLDFDKSPCAPKAAGFEKAIAVRIFPHIEADGGLAFRDGKFDWRQPLGLMSPDQMFEVTTRATSDGWAVYQLHEAASAASFSVQYMLGDLASGACLTMPARPQSVSLDDMPPMALQLYLERLTGDGSGSPDAMRQRLASSLGIKNADAGMNSPSIAAGPATATGQNGGATVVEGSGAKRPDASGLTDICGRDVDSILVERGHTEPYPVLLVPDVGADTDVGYQEWSDLAGNKNPITIHCPLSAGSKEHLKVTLPGTFNRCLLMDQRMLCGAASSASPEMNASQAGASPSERFACEQQVNLDKRPFVQRLYLNQGANKNRYYDVGDREWKQYFRGATAEQRELFEQSTPRDGWVAWHVETEPRIRFTGQYFFEDKSGNCVAFPADAAVVSPFAMPIGAVTHYYEMLDGGSSRDLEVMRRALTDVQEKTVSTLVPPNGESGSGTQISAKPPKIENACGRIVESALIEIGSHQPPRIFTPEQKDGRWEFSFLKEAGDESIGAMCFGTKDEASLYRVPLPKGLERCVFSAGALACWDSQEQTDGELERMFSSPDDVPKDAAGRAALKARLNAMADRMVESDPYSLSLLDEPKALIQPQYTGERPSLEGLPESVAMEFVKWDTGCGNNANGSFTEDFLTKIDIDGNGSDDFVLNGDGASCVRDGKTVSRGGGNGGTSLKVFTRQGKKITKALSIFTQGAEIRTHKGFAVVTTTEGNYKLANGKASKLKNVPKGGQLVYSLGR